MATGTLRVLPHHEQRKVCASRAKYREGRNPRAVKVYTINLESRYLLVQGVPAIGVMKELVEQFALYGAIEEYNVLHEYPAEDFTEVFLIKFQRLQSARIAKRKLDERSFFGGLLHICYAPEHESVQETREKLQERRRYVARTTSDKDHHVAEKTEKEPNTSTPMPAHSKENHTLLSSRDSDSQSCILPAPVYPLPPSVTPNYRHEYALPPSVNLDHRQEYALPPSLNPYCLQGYAFPPSVNFDYRQDYALPPSLNPDYKQDYALPPSVNPNYKQGYGPPPSLNPDYKQGYAPPPSVIPDYNQGYDPPPSLNPDYKQGYAPPPSVNPDYKQGYSPPLSLNPDYKQGYAPPPSLNPDYKQGYAPPPSLNPDYKWGYAPPPSLNTDYKRGYAPSPSLNSDYYRREYGIPASVNQDYRQESYTPLDPSDFRTKSGDSARHATQTSDLQHGRPGLLGSASTRFMPRTTQLQERQRRREENTLALSLPESQEIVIGPKLPEIPKLDLDDASLNTSADLIRGKLKEVSTSRAAPPAGESQPAPPPKQRRRI